MTIFHCMNENGAQYFPEENSRECPRKTEKICKDNSEVPSLSEDQVLLMDPSSDTTQKVSLTYISYCGYFTLNQRILFNTELYQWLNPRNTSYIVGNLMHAFGFAMTLECSQCIFHVWQNRIAEGRVICPGHTLLTARWRNKSGCQAPKAVSFLYITPLHWH